MENAPRKTSRSLKIAAMIIILIIVALGLYAAWTYPRTLLNLSVSFTVGAQSQNKEFNVPMLDSWVQVQVSVISGTTLWVAGIAGSNNTEVWTHAAAQGEQTTYNSGWIQIANGNYNFTFGAVGVGTLSAPLNADIAVSSKGGFW